MDDFNKKVIKGFAWEASTRFVVQIASWVSTIWVARLLSPDDYGLVGISGIFTGLCLVLSGMGLSGALINKKDLAEHDMANIFWTSAILAFVFYLALYLLAPAIANHYGAEELQPIIRVAGIMVIASPLSVVPRALVARELRFKAIALISMGTNIVVIALTLTLAFLGWSYWALIISTVTAEVFSLIAYMIVARYFPSRPRNIKSVIPMYRYGVHILGARLVAYLNRNWPIIIAGNVLGKTSAGHYQFANTIAAIPMTKIGEIFTSIAFPAFSRIKNDDKKIKQLFLTMHRYLLIIIAPMFLGLAVTASEFVPLLLGEKWLLAVVPIQIICLANIFSGSAMIIPRVFEGMGNAKASFKYEVFLAILAPVAMLVGIRWGLNGMLIGWALTKPLGYIYLLSVLFNSLRMTFAEFWSSISRTCLCLVVMSVAIAVAMSLVTKDIDITQVLALKVFVGSIAYFGCYCVVGRDDINRVVLLIRSRRVES